MTAAAPALPEPFAGWFASRGWRPHAHQLAMLEAARLGQSVLLVAPTGGGKTLAGFLPSLLDLAGQAQRRRLHTLYVSPLKALAVDIQRNLEAPVAEMGLAVRAETRTGDTPQARRQRQLRQPPDILLTTPESLALLLSQEDAPDWFADLSTVVIDEVHALAGSKRGDLLALGLARLRALAPAHRITGLSATIDDPDAMAGWLAGRRPVRTILAPDGPPPEIRIMAGDGDMPWSGHMALHAVPRIYDAIRQAGTTLVFVNTRAQAELIFRALWHANDDGLAIALHHGSLAVDQRRRVEAAMAAGRLRAVVATSSLDLGIDWGAVDLVIQTGAPKGAARLVQRTGRANHRLDRPSRALLVPANRFEVLECQAAIEAVAAHDLDDPPRHAGGLDVLAQHLLGMACCRPFTADAMFDEVRDATPYADLTRTDFDAVLAYVATGGYALGGYDRFRRLRRNDKGAWQVADRTHLRRYRMNIGTIVESTMLKVRLGRGRVLGEIEEYFVLGLTPGDTFLFAGQLLQFVRIHEMAVETRRPTGPDISREPQVPTYQGGRLPLTTQLADRVRALLADKNHWPALPPPVQEWLRIQARRSRLPDRRGLLIETFPRGGKHYLVAYCFEGRNAHQTLGMLLTRRMDRAGLGPLGFVATDYVIAIWSLSPLTTLAEASALFDQDMLGDDLEAWMAESSLLRRTFRNVAVIAGLIERRHPGQEKTRRQVTFNADLIYDVLRRYEPDHILLRATRADAATGLTDVSRLAAMLKRIAGRIRLQALDRISPLAVPILLEVGRESVSGDALDELMDQRETELVAEALDTDKDRTPRTQSTATLS
ncbi:MAG: ligase-associated DNA damage response DEXH box helicase [Alphaproteobacteria bacterium]